MTKTLIEKDLGTELMLYDPVQDEVHVLNGTAQLIYRLHNEGKELKEIEQAIRENYHLRENQDLAANIEECLSELRSKGLIPGKG